MNDAIDEAYDAWREADAAARAVQREVGDAWRRHHDKLGEPPSRERMREMAWLRHDAADKLRKAIDLLHQAGLIHPSSASRAPAAAPCE